MTAAFMQKSDQNVEKNQSYQTFYRELNFVKDLNELIKHK